MINVLFPIRFDYLRKGGVTNFVISMLSHLKHTNIIGLNFNSPDPKTIQIYPETSFTWLRRRISIFKDIILLNQKLKNHRIDLVHINPSFSKKSLLKNLPIVNVANKNKIPVIIFFHGWDTNFEKYFKNKLILRKFREIYGSAKIIFVLATEFKNKLVELGFDEKRITVETTMVDDSLVESFNFEKKIVKSQTKHHINILFLSRIEKNKGIYEAIDAFKRIKKNTSNARFIVAGDGRELCSVKKYVHKLKLRDVYFPGFLINQSKIDVLEQADLLLFPTSYGEGMPIAVLESLAFGLPIISRPVGGLKDFFQNGKMGYLIKGTDPNIFAEFIEKLIKNPQKRKQISKYNYEYAKQHFLASRVTSRIEKFYIKNSTRYNFM